MDVLEALKYFRKKKKIAQKDVLPKKENKPIEESKLVKPS